MEKKPDTTTIQPEHEIRQNTLHEESNELEESVEQKEVPFDVPCLMHFVYFRQLIIYSDHIRNSF